MRTNVLAYVIGVVGLIVILAAVWGLFILLTGNMPRVPLRYYALALGMVAGGLSMIGVAQTLRLLRMIALGGNEKWEAIRTFDYNARFRPPAAQPKSSN
jgi:hypothetical protein